MKRIFLFTILLAVFGVANAQQGITAQFPQASIAGKSSGEITLAEIKAAGELTTTHDQLRVIGFAIRIGESKIKTEVGSCAFTNEQIRLIASATKGSKMTIEDILTLNPQDRQIELQDIVFTLR